jgi:ubiquinone/menaquinone biosynthesis C-methylase UbiE
MTTEWVIPHQRGEWERLDNYLIYLRHLASYRFAQSMAEGRRVLDLGCGTGYGAILIAERANEVVALDLAPHALSAQKHTAATAKFAAGDSLQLPFRAEAFDLIVSFQVIEHIWDEIRYLDEVRRVLAPRGLFLVSTPNKRLRLLPLQPPFNPYHVREYDYRSLKRVLNKRFEEVSIWGLRGTPRIMAVEQERLRKNPVKVYMKLISSRILPAPMRRRLRGLSSVFSLHRQLELPISSNPTTLPPFSEDHYSVDELWIDPDNIKTSLDLIGICRKS